MEKQKKKRIALGAFFGLFSAAVVAAMVTIPLTFALVIKGTGGDEPISEHGFGLYNYRLIDANPLCEIYCESHDAHILSNFILKDEHGTTIGENSQTIELEAGTDKYAEVNFPQISGAPYQNVTLTFNVEGFEESETIGDIIIVGSRIGGWSTWNEMESVGDMMMIESSDSVDLEPRKSYKTVNLNIGRQTGEPPSVNLSFEMINKETPLSLKIGNLASLNCRIGEVTYPITAFGQKIGSNLIYLNTDTPFILEDLHDQSIEFEVTTFGSFDKISFRLYYESAQ